MKKKFHITKHDKEVLENTQKQHLGEMRFAAQVTVDGDHWSVEVVDWFEFYEPSATPYDAIKEWCKAYSVVVNKTLIFHQVWHVRDFLDTHYRRAHAVDYLFDQPPHRVRAGDHRSMVFVELPNDMICRLEAIWRGDLVDRKKEDVTEVRIIFERGAT